MADESQFQRLFLGLPLPDNIRRELMTLQPRRGGGVRPIDSEQMHITLHFIGQAEPAYILRSLGDIEQQAFTLVLNQLGHFGSAQRGGILWVGSDQHPALNRLHRVVGQRLQTAGLELDDRPFKPHVTLARCRPGSPGHVFKSFLQQEIPTLAPLQVNELVLYSSSTSPAGSVYTRESSWLLQPES